MPRKLYAIEVAVRDFEAAAEVFTALMGREGSPMWDDYDPSGTLRAIYFRNLGLEAFGVMSTGELPSGSVAERIAQDVQRRGDGVSLVCFEAHDLDELQNTLQGDGGRFVFDVPVEVGDERMNMIERCGVNFVFAHHKPGHWEKWRRGELSGAGKVPEVKTRHRVESCYSLDIVTNDLAATGSWFEQVLGAPGVPAEIDDGTERCQALEFSIAGMELLRVAAPETSSATGTASGPLARHLAHYGEGVARMGLRVADVALATSELEQSGIKCEPQKAGGSGRRYTITEPIHGVVFELCSTTESPGSAVRV